MQRARTEVGFREAAFAAALKVMIAGLSAIGGKTPGGATSRCLGLNFIPIGMWFSNYTSWKTAVISSGPILMTVIGIYVPGQSL